MAGKITIPTKRRNKYGAKRTTVDGITFDSKHEAERWGELCIMQRAGLIFDLKRQVPFDLVVGGVHICKYVADFVYRQKSLDERGVAGDVADGGVDLC